MLARGITLLDFDLDLGFRFYVYGEVCGRNVVFFGSVWGAGGRDGRKGNQIRFKRFLV